MLRATARVCLFGEFFSMKRLCLVLGLLAVSVASFAKSEVWFRVPNRPSDALVGVTQNLQEYVTFNADPYALQNTLLLAPMETQTNSNYIVWMPNPDGGLERFRLFEAPIQTPAVQRQTGVRTYGAQGVDDPTATGKFDIGRNGFHGMVRSTRGTYFIEPLELGEQVRHIVFYRSDFMKTRDFACLGAIESAVGATSKGEGGGPVALRPGPNRKEYRLAIKGTVEYTAFFGGVANANAGSVTTINRVNGVYEEDIAIRMIVVNMVNYATEPDPYTNNNGFTMLSQNQATCDAVPGNANYDIGHVFSTGGGGVAGLQVVGVTGQKARGVTGLPSPIGDIFAIDFVAHEMGHQFGANHTFNGTTSNCGGGNRSAAHAYEPGSGSTIMAYAGICGAENLQSFSDDYFHTDSQQFIEAWRNNAGSGGSTVATGNLSPVFPVLPNFTIPRDTPFRLSASATDANGDPLTYCWEQFNLGQAGPAINEANSPLFRSRQPVASGTRWFPPQVTVLNNGSDPWENLPSLDRTMNFRVTARDNRAGGGNFEWASNVITVSGTPFQVTSPNTAVNWTGNSNQTVTWNVGGGSAAPNVRILLSTDGGNSFYNGTATVLLASTPNDGSEQITVPNVNTSTARIFVEGVNNVFYDVSNVNFTITPVVAQIVNPTSYVVTDGSEAIHDLPAMLLSDDVRHPISSNFPAGYTTAVEYTTTAPVMTVNRVSFILEHQSIEPGRQRVIEMWNYTTAAWEVVSTTAGTTVDSTIKVDVTTNPGRFINAGNREMKARIRLFSSPPQRKYRSIVDRLDRTVWELSS
jgi:hypothetical protein